MFTKSGAPTGTDAHFRALLHMSLGSPVKEPSLKVPFTESLAEMCLVPGALFISLSNFQVFEPPPPPDTSFPSIIKGPIERERDTRIRRLSEHIFQGPQ